VTSSKDDIAKFKDVQVKRENVKQRVETLVGNKVRFKWDWGPLLAHPRLGPKNGLCRARLWCARKGTFSLCAGGWHR